MAGASQLDRQEALTGGKGTEGKETGILKFDHSSLVEQTPLRALVLLCLLDYNIQIPHLFELV